MKIFYNDKTDLLYIRLDEASSETINKRVSEDIVLDVAQGEKIVGIEFLNASAHVNLKDLLPIQYEIPKKR